MERELSTHQKLRSACVAALLALLCTAALEAARVPLQVYAAAPQLAIGVLALALWRALFELAASVGLVPAIALVHVWHARRRASAAARAATAPNAHTPALLAAALGALVAFAAYRTLVRYLDFAGYPPAVALFALLAIGVGLASALEPRALAASKRRGLRRFGQLLPLGAGLAAVLCFVLNTRVYPGDYPTLHLSVVQCALALAALALFHAFERWPALIERLSLRARSPAVCRAARAPSRR